MPSKRLKLPVYKYADVSSGHITQKDAELLDIAASFAGRYAGVPLIAKYAKGWFLSTRPDWYDEEQWAMDLTELGFSRDFIGLWHEVSKKGCQILRLDADGEQIAGLPLHQW